MKFLILSNSSLKNYLISLKTTVILCRCSTSAYPPVLFPPVGTALACNNDANGNPFQDCFNSLGAVCKTDFVVKNGKNIFRSSCGSGLTMELSDLSL